MAYSQSAWAYSYSAYSMVYLENHTAGHRKFYKMTRTSNGWTAHWGKIGTSGQTMDYRESFWFDKLKEKLAKGYEVTNAQSLSVSGTPPPPIVPKTDVDTDPELIAKIDRIILFLEDRQKKSMLPLAESIKLEYIRSGVLTKSDMKKLNDFWIRAGGGKW